ncbi:MAG: phenylacetate--CoA ligase family protein [Verrucomicrobiales bacterium]|nr:phenylacetate--CoA ligase family protein [Verrucomicrobiales bacterium]
MAHFLERFYPFVPAPLQNLGISLYGFAWKRERLGGQFPRYVSEFRERDRWSPEQMGAHLKTELRRLLCHAFDRVPYYQRLWQKHGITRKELAQIEVDQLSRIPHTPKEDLRANADSFVAQNVPREKLNRYFSSGSTGTPITSICTADDHQKFIAARDVRSLGWAGTSIRSPRSMIGGRSVVPQGVSRPPFHRYNWAEEQLYFSAYHIAPANIAHYVAALNHHQPGVLTGYAHSHFLLAQMMCAQNLSLDYEPMAAVLSSEKLTRQMKATIKRALRTRAFEEYGAVENCVLATECECGHLHANLDFGILEIVDDDGQPMPPGVDGRVLCTGLLNHTQPLIRYEIGDVASWSLESCACGREHLPVIKEIVGRLEDVIVGPDGRQLVRFHWVALDLPDIMETQVVQEALDQFTVKVVTRNQLDREIEQIIQRRFCDRLGPVSVRLERVSSIPRSERGKFRSVISKISLPARTPFGCAQLAGSL